ncbi:MAG TPA: ATP-binding protein [Blastocatellia bacterium]|nr:ATP-binding protein [Blastocatellia bacterium]
MALFLVVTIGAVNVVVGYFTLRQREEALRSTMRSGVQVYAQTIKIALESLYGAERGAEAQRLIDRLGENVHLFSAALYDERGHAIVSSNPSLTDQAAADSEIQLALTTGSPIERFHRLAGQEFFCMIMPVKMGAAGQGAFEIMQPASVIEDDLASARQDFIVTRLAVITAIIIVITSLLRFNLDRHIKALIRGAMAIGEGDLSYRVTVRQRGGEFVRLADEFNHMAARLAEQRETMILQAEQQLALERELRHRDRLVVVGRLAASIAHEMGTPLNVIDGRAAQLQARFDASDEVRQRNLAIIRAQTGRIARFVRRLLHLAHPHDLHREPLNLAQVIKETLELLESNASRAGVELQFTVDDPALPVQVEADQDLLHQVLLNICLNGIQAMTNGGCLRLECVRNGEIKDRRGFVAVRISDTGEGIAPEHLHDIFEPFFTTKDVGEGTGLGLAVSRRIIEEHGGWIEAVNQAESGAAFTIYLPQAETAVATAR